MFAYPVVSTHTECMQGQEQVLTMGTGSEGATVDCNLSHFIAIIVHNKESVKVPTIVGSALYLFSVHVTPSMVQSNRKGICSAVGKDAIAV